MKNYLKINCYGEDFKVEIKKNSYANNRRLAVQLVCDDGIPFGTITTNIKYPLSTLDKYLAFIDTNNYPYIEKWLIDNGIAYPTGHIGYSGFCAYPEYKFNETILEYK